MKIRFNLISLFMFSLAHGVSGVEKDEVSAFVMTGDSVTLHTDVTTIQQQDIKWYFNYTRIAEITEDLGDICTDVQCNEGAERFRHRLELDHWTGSLTITNTRTTDSGLYELKIISIRISSEKTFSVTVHDVPAAEQDEMKRKSVKEGESVTLDTGVTKNPNDLMTWHFKAICIAEISEEPRKICTDVQCKDGDERFRNRLKLDHQTGSLTITNTTITDSGVYQLQINSSSFSIIRSFSVTVTDSGLSSAAVAGICAAVVGVVVVVIVILLLMAVSRYTQLHSLVRRNDTRTKHSNQANGFHDLSPNQSDIPLVDDVSETPSNHTNAVVMNTIDGLSSNHIEIESAAATEM
ncbi:uncharacterized protein LOC127161324 [Labeo rohita]|uniref:uncharacterized protein LOC127161324 n=1 Tax=Labeo rohita TaxID=84645 RepID=UPI0021E291B3|nr:uncharacterized protein LOC127161324 [Labeo rohita]